MVDLNKAMHEALETLDTDALGKIWAIARPGMPQLRTDKARLAAAHMARTQMPTIAFRLRAYSHAWLLERGYPSQLPDEMRRSAERVYPVKVGVVGISVNAPAHRADLAKEIRTSMEYAVEDCYANGDKDPAIVHPRMMEARRNALKR
jgi:hypothetical protein